MKKSIVVGIILLVLVISVGTVYAVDMDRMKNNKPVLFSTWGYDYTPPEELGEIVDIVDKTKTEDIVCAQALEKFYEDTENEYYFSCIKSSHIIVKFQNNYSENVKSAFENGNITLKDLDKFNIDYIIEKKIN